MAGATVTVASKLPYPLTLQLQRKVQRVEEHISGARTVEAYVKDDSSPAVILAGCAINRGEPSSKALYGGFALTHNVDAEFWKAWLAQNQQFPPVQKGLVFACEKPGAAESDARDRAKLKSGYEPFDPEDPPAEFKARVAQYRAS